MIIHISKYIYHYLLNPLSNFLDCHGPLWKPSIHFKTFYCQLLLKYKTRHWVNFVCQCTCVWCVCRCECACVCVCALALSTCTFLFNLLDCMHTWPLNWVGEGLVQTPISWTTQWTWSWCVWTQFVNVPMRMQHGHWLKAAQSKLTSLVAIATVQKTTTKWWCSCKT